MLSIWWRKCWVKETVMSGSFRLNHPMSPLGLVFLEFLVRKSPIVATECWKYKFREVVLFRELLILLVFGVLLIVKVLFIFFLEIVCKLDWRLRWVIVIMLPHNLRAVIELDVVIWGYTRKLYRLILFSWSRIHHHLLMPFSKNRWTWLIANRAAILIDLGAIHYWAVHWCSIISGVVLIRIWLRSILLDLVWLGLIMGFCLI